MSNPWGDNSYVMATNGRSLFFFENLPPSSPGARSIAAQQFGSHQTPSPCVCVCVCVCVGADEPRDGFESYQQRQTFILLGRRMSVACAPRDTSSEHHQRTLFSHTAYMRSSM
jgi:hypothetical protein